MHSSEPEDIMIWLWDIFFTIILEGVFISVGFTACGTEEQLLQLCSFSTTLAKIHYLTFNEDYLKVRSPLTAFSRGQSSPCPNSWLKFGFIYFFTMFQLLLLLPSAQVKYEDRDAYQRSCHWYLWATFTAFHVNTVSLLLISIKSLWAILSVISSSADTVDSDYTRKGPNNTGIRKLYPFWCVPMYKQWCLTNF